MQARCTLADENLAEARRSLIREQARYERARDAVRDADRRITDLERLVETWERSRAGMKKIEEDMSRLMGDLHSSRERQVALRKHQRQTLGRFRTCFERIVRAFLGDDVTVRVAIEARELKLSVERNGDRDSAAVTTVKLLSFDLAALVAGLEGLGCFPGFLLHDGPRSADVASDVYERLFLYVQELESLFPDQPGFQYIVTTTSEPPEVAQREPWLRLQLSGVPTEERLFRMDL